MSPRSVFLLAIAFGASLVAAVAVAQFDLGRLPWAVSRASGIAAFAVLSAAVLTGLLMSTKASDGLMSRPFVFEMHQFLSVTSVVLIAVHAGSLLFDAYLEFSSFSLVVPFLSPYRPLAVSAGVMAGWMTALVTASFWFRARIGSRRWRTLHYITFLGYVMALGHGFFAGTDSQLPFVYWSYIVSAGAVTALTVLRITGYRQPRRAPAKARTVSSPVGRVAG